MIVIIGESGSGKSTVQKELQKMGILKVITCTTRPSRSGEVSGVDYHFLSKEEFDKKIESNEFSEHASYNGWNYGTPKDSCGTSDTCTVLTPSGLRAIRRSGIPCVSFYLKVDRRSRLVMMLKRGDDIDEAYRRNLSDLGQFDEVDKEVDYTIDNAEYAMSAKEIATRIFGIYKNKEHRSKEDL